MGARGYGWLDQEVSDSFKNDLGVGQIIILQKKRVG